jgi:hypothetical protein
MINKGDSIPGSNLVRTFCVSCGEPIRCSMTSICLPHECEVCNPKQETYIDLQELGEFESQEAKVVMAI